VAAAAFVTLMGLASLRAVVDDNRGVWAGFCVSGRQIGVNALAAEFYPTACRATGASWALGIGRSGSIAGSLVGGVMLTQGWARNDLRPRGDSSHHRGRRDSLAGCVETLSRRVRPLTTPQAGPGWDTVRIANVPHTRSR
jgi:hypothetical protein